MTETRETMLDDALPTLQINYPTCSHCHNDVMIEDDSAYCETCKVNWPRIEDGAIAEPGVWGEEEPKCKHVPEEKLNEYEYKGEHVTIRYKKCILPLSHGGKHLHPHSYKTEPITPETQARVAALSEKRLAKVRAKLEAERGAGWARRGV